MWVGEGGDRSRLQSTLDILFRVSHRLAVLFCFVFVLFLLGGGLLASQATLSWFPIQFTDWRCTLIPSESI